MITINLIKDSINEIRAMTSKMRNFFGDVSQEIMGRLINIMVPLQQIIIGFRDFIGRVQGTMTAALFTLFGSYLGLKSLLGVIVHFLVTILIALAAMIVIFWLFPFTWGTAVASTAIFVAISIPLAILLTFMTNALGINSGLSIPRLHKPSLKCFDKNTEFIMKDGNVKKISEIKVGEKLEDGSAVTAKIIVDVKDSIMYNLNGIIVSDSHKVCVGVGKWIHVDQHPLSKKIEHYSEPYLFCLNTSSKIIRLRGINFSDWDEIWEDELEKIKQHKILNLKYGENLSNLDMEVVNSDIHKYLDGGFNENTEIKLKNGFVKKIKHISVGDILQDGEKVYGIVEIDGLGLVEQANYYLGKNKFFSGGNNINLCDNRYNYTSTLEIGPNNKIKKLKSTGDMDIKLYHLLTDKKTFSISGVRFYDYNSCIDLFLEKYRGKLLSMKYV